MAAEFDIHDPRHWVVGRVLQYQAITHGAKTFVTMVDGDSVTFADADRHANQVANFLSDIGVERNEMVAVLLPNGLEYCYAWFGISRLGAVHVAINTEYKGAFLRHVLHDCAAKTLIIHAEYLPALSEIIAQLHHLQQIVVVTDEGAPGVSLPLISAHRFSNYHAYPSDTIDVAVGHFDIGCVMYTSGTTGPAKGVLMPHAHNYLFALGTIDHLHLTRDDVFYIVLPLFHANGMFMQLYAALVCGASAVIRKKFSASRWIQDVVGYDITHTNTLGVVSAFIVNQPPTPADRKHRLRAIGVAPNVAEIDIQFRQRFGIRDVVGLYGMTEINIPLYIPTGEHRPGSCGKVWDKYYELRLVDPQTDESVASNTIGEIVVRPKQPFGFMAGYLNMPQQTLQSWRNFWFHTGDAATMDEEGYVYFVDRIKDCIRRRGENISSVDLESVIGSHQAILEIAALAVKSEILGGEDEIKVVVVLKDGMSLHSDELLSYCRRHLPAFAIPRYIEFRSSLPKTPTGKIQKNRLRKDISNKISKIQ